MTSGKRRQTFEKMNRERKVREKRALKAEKRELRRLGPPPVEAAADDMAADTADDTAAETAADTVDSPETEPQE